MADGALSWLRVVDCTDLRGALCARILADLGADVVRIEPPGTPDRQHTSTAHRYRNANKRGAAIALHTASGRSRLDALLADADVLVENAGVSRHDAWGVTPASVVARHPHLVHVALTDLGLTGPRAHWHLEALPALAASGALWASGFPDRPPTGPPGHLAHDCASVHGALGALAALAERRRSGRGQLVEVSAQEAALAGTTPWSIAMASYLEVNPLLPVAGTRNADGAYWVFPAKDGWVRVVVGSPRQWDGFVALLGRPDALSGPEWHTPGFRVQNLDVVRLLADEGFLDRTRQELVDQALGTGATVGVLQTPGEFARHPQSAARRTFVATGWPGLGDAPFLQPAVRLSATPTSVRRPAPVPGDDVAAFASRDLIEPRPSPEPSATLPLAGVRVVEFGVAAVVPELCWMLSELGADVIKIESVAHPDVLRQTGGARINCGFAFNTECRGRRSVALDLGTDEGRALALRLCATADVVAENHRGGVLDKLGLGASHVRALNPSVIYVSSQGYGRGGPLGEMPAYGPLNSGFSGVHLLWSDADAPYPCGTSLNHPDHIAGKLLACAVLAALDHRARTGEGQDVEMAQTEASAYFHGEVYLDTSLAGIDPTSGGDVAATRAPCGVHRAAGDDAWIAVAATEESWPALAALVGLDASAYPTVATRIDARSAIDAAIGAWTVERDAATAADVLQAVGVSAMPVMGPIDHHADAHLAARGAIVVVEHPEVGPERQIGNPTRLSRTALRVAPSAPCLGAHTREVLGTVLGVSDAELDELEGRGVLR